MILPYAGLAMNVPRITPRMMMRAKPVRAPKPMKSKGSMATEVVAAAPRMIMKARDSLDR